MQSNRTMMKKAIFWVIAVIQLHVLLLKSGGLAKATETKRSARRSSGCPFKRTSAFIEEHTAFITNSLFLGGLGSSKRIATEKRLSSLRFLKDIGRMETTISAQTIDAETVVKIQEAAEASGKKKKKDKKDKKPVEALEVVVLGLSHHNAKVEVREKLAIPEDNWNDAATELASYPSIGEAAVLSTCNRFELYLAGKNQYECIRDAIDFLHKRAGGTLDQVTLRKNLFMLSGEDAIWHLLRVSAGLDSLVVGEGQILAQVKRAYEHGIEETGQSGKVISRMLNTAVTSGKRVRSETGISKGAVSISSAAAEFTALKIKEDCNIADGLKEAKITIIGAGKMARLLLVHLQTQGVTAVTIVNRSKERVFELQKEFPDLTLHLKLMDEMWDVIRDSDVVFPSTAATTTIIDPEPLAASLVGRSRPGGIQFVDISVPRNVHPDCAEVEGAHCYNVDDLKAVVERNTAKRRREMLEAEVILQEEMGKFRLWQQSLGAIPTIARLQQKAETLRQEELNKAASKLSSLSEKDLETVEKVTRGIVAKLLHGPMNHLRQQTESDATRAAIQQVQKAFQLEQ